MIYLDNAATTFPKPEAVYCAMDEMNRKYAVNAGRGSYHMARQASRLVAETKAQIREIVHADADAAVIFAPSITIALNQIINGLRLRNGAVVYVSPYEHNAVARCLHSLEKEKKLTIIELAVDSSTLEVDLERIKYQFSVNKPEAVFCTHISNVTGYVLPVEKIFEEAKRFQSITVLDTAQSLGLLDVNAGLVNADIIAFAGHKSLYGPFGIGGFVNISNVVLNEFITGGTGSNSLDLGMPDEKEARFEAGSCNIVAVAGLNAALRCLKQKDIFSHEMELTKYLVDELKKIRGIRVFESKNQIGIVSFIYEELKSEELGHILDEDYDIAVRTGYHCAPYIHKHMKDEAFLGTVRIGIGQFTSKPEIETLINALKEIAYE